MKNEFIVAAVFLFLGLAMGLMGGRAYYINNPIIVEKECTDPLRVGAPKYILVKEPIPEPLLDDAEDHKEEITLPEIKDLTTLQVRNLLIAKRLGEPYNLSRTAMGIMFQESLAGLMPAIGDLQLPEGNRSYGLMQVRLGAVKDAIRFNPDLGPYTTDEEMIDRLINDKEYNVRIGINYFRWLQDRGLSWRESLTAYNRGFSTMKRMDNPDEWYYTNRIARHITTGPVSRLEKEDSE